MVSSTPSHRGPQRIVILCDGTWQKRRSVRSMLTGGGVYTTVEGSEKWFTNVALLGRCIASSGRAGVRRSNAGAPDGVDVPSSYVLPQTVYYQDGIGASPYVLAKLVEGATGVSLDLKVQQVYSFLVDNFLAGDELFFFGFSRGAYTVRTIAAFINYVGILSRQESADHFVKLWDAFRSRDPSNPASVAKAEQTVFDALGRWPSANAMNSARDNVQVAEVMAGKATVAEVERAQVSLAVGSASDGDQDEQKRSPCTVPPTIQVIGVFDTVGALGVPGFFLNPQKQQYYSFFDPMLAPNVRHAFHALSLFEDRKDFLPTIWALPKRESPQDAARRRGQELKQCWFQGSHSDVGGGHPWHGLSDITFAWMIAQLVDRPNGEAPLLEINVPMARSLQDLRLPWARQPQHPSRAAIEFQGTRYVNGWSVPSSVEKRAVWRNVVNRDATFESIHHSVVVGQQYDPHTCPQFSRLRSQDAKGSTKVDKRLERLWNEAKDPSSLSATERTLFWTPDESEKVMEQMIEANEKGANDQDVIFDSELTPDRPSGIPKGVWKAVKGVAFSPLLALSFIVNWKIPLVEHTSIPQDNLSPPTLLSLFNKLNKGHQAPSTAIKSATTTTTTA